MAPDPWFSTYDSTCQIAQEIAEKIQQRSQYERKGEKTTKLTVTIRALLQNLKEKIALLKDLLLRAVSTHQMYPPNVLAKQDLPKEFSRLGGTFTQRRRLGLCLRAVCTELCPVPCVASSGAPAGKVSQVTLQSPELSVIHSSVERPTQAGSIRKFTEKGIRRWPQRMELCQSEARSQESLPGLPRRCRGSRT